MISKYIELFKLFLMIIINSSTNERLLYVFDCVIFLAYYSIERTKFRY